MCYGILLCTQSHFVPPPFVDSSTTRISNANSSSSRFSTSTTSLEKNKDNDPLLSYSSQSLPVNDIDIETSESASTISPYFDHVALDDLES